MSLAALALRTGIPRPPRVSGDEPALQDAADTLSPSAPRKRG